MVGTRGTRADRARVGRLTEGLDADCLIADRGHGSNAILEQAEQPGMQAVVPPKKNRTGQRPHDEDPCKLCHRVENAFLHLKRRRGIATRYAKTTSSYLAAVHIRCLALCAGVS